MSKELNKDDISVYNSSLLQEAVTLMATYFSPMLAYANLRQPDTRSIQASSIENEDRLQVNGEVAITVAALFAVCLLFAVISLRYVRELPHTGYRDPLTLLGYMTMIKNKRGNPLENFPGNATIRKRLLWRRCSFTPLVQRSLPRTLLLFFVFSSMIGMGTTLWLSKMHNGLVTVLEDGHVLLQLASVSAMLIVSLYSSSIDMSFRSLAILSNVSQRPCDSLELDGSLLDMMGLRVLVYSVRHRLFAASTLQALAVILAFLPIVSSVLLYPELVPLYPELVPNSTELVINQKSWFGVNNSTVFNKYRERRVHGTLSRLLKTKNLSNFTYPENTYADLVFPNFTIDDTIWGPGVSANIVLPAAKMVSKCERLSDDEFDIVVAPPEEWSNTTSISIFQSIPCPGDTHVRNTSTLLVSSWEGPSYVA